MGGVKNPVVSVYRVLLRHARTLDRSDMLPFLLRPAGGLLSPATFELARPILEDAAKGKTSLTDACRNAFRATVPGEPQQQVNVLRQCFEVNRFAGSVAAVASASTSKRFAVGDVVEHRLWRQNGVVLATHDRCTQPPEWILTMLGDLSHPFLKEPWYDILLDSQVGGFVRHGAQRTHEKVLNTQVDHPVVRQQNWEFLGAEGRYRI
eukprot:TRINITY_DN31346_c0_g1_i1.p1 TRINITY_DN31346_c0_g1~~TRINITY_DN31346_c0_g1_i1.p1  ORF type:complete len:207 (+),score=38.25 TRINITY_DN31346_c0_g1_i1:55-675(+)